MGRPWSNEAFITAVRSGSKLKQEGGNGRRPLGGRAHRHAPESAVQQASFPLIFLPLPVDFLPLLHLCTPTPELTVHTSSALGPRAGAASEGAVSGGVDWRGKKQEEHRRGLLPSPLHTLLPAQWVYLFPPCVSGPVVLHQGSEGRGVPSLAAVGPCPRVRGQAVGFHSTMMWCIVLVPTRNPFWS